MQNVCGLYNVAIFTFLSVERCGPENLLERHVPRDLLNKPLHKKTYLWAYWREPDYVHTQISCRYIVHDNYVIDDCRSNCHEMGMLCSLVCNFA